MKNIFRKFVVTALSSLVILQACQTPNVNTIDLNKSNQNAFNTKAETCDTKYFAEVWDVDDGISISSTNGSISLYPGRSTIREDITSLLKYGDNNINIDVSNGYGGYAYGVNIIKEITTSSSVSTETVFSAYKIANGWGETDWCCQYSNIHVATVPAYFSCNAPSPTATPTINPTIAPTINPTPEPTIPPTTGDCSAKSINDFNKNVDDTTDALNKLNYLFSLVSSTSGFKTKATYNSPMYDQGAYDFALDIQQRTSEVKAMENSAIEAERLAYNEYKFEAAKIGVSAGLVIASAGMSAVPGFLTQLSATSPEVFFLAVESPQVLAALNRASALIAALKILKSGDSCLTPALATGVNDSKVAVNNIDEFLNGIFKAVGKNSGSGNIIYISTSELRSTEFVNLNLSKVSSGRRKVLEQLINEIKTNGVKETIKYVEENGIKYVVDGNHRLAISKFLNIDKVPVEKVSLPYKGFKTPADLRGN